LLFVFIGLALLSCVGIALLGAEPFKI